MKDDKFLNCRLMIHHVHMQQSHYENQKRSQTTVAKYITIKSVILWPVSWYKIISTKEKYLPQRLSDCACYPVFTVYPLNHNSNTEGFIKDKPMSFSSINRKLSIKSTV